MQATVKAQQRKFIRNRARQYQGETAIACQFFDIASTVLCSPCSTALRHILHTPLMNFLHGASTLWHCNAKLPTRIWYSSLAPLYFLRAKSAIFHLSCEQTLFAIEIGLIMLTGLCVLALNRKSVVLNFLYFGSSADCDMVVDLVNLLSLR